MRWSPLAFALSLALVAPAATAKPPPRPASRPTARPTTRPATRPTTRPTSRPTQSDDFDFGDDDGDGGKGAGDSKGAANARDDGKPAKPKKPARSSRWALTGFARSDWALWTERFSSNPFAKGRQNLDLALRYTGRILSIHLAGHIEYDAAYLVERDSYDKPTRDAYEWLLNSRELQVSLSLGAFEITVGRQILAWGVGDAVSALDLVNPRDLREPGLADLADIRQPVLSTRVGWFHGAHRVEVMVIHESDFGFRPAPRSPFSPLDALVADDPLLAALVAGKTLRYEHAQSRFAGDQQQVLARWVYRGAGIDFGIQVASVLDLQGVFAIDPTRIDLSADTIPITLDHPRFFSGGYHGAAPVGDFVFKWEVGAEIGRKFNVGTPSTLAIAETDVVNLVGVVTYSGVTDLSVTLEIFKRFLVNRPDALLYDPDAPIIAARARYTLLRERLTLLAAVTVFGWRAEQGAVLRAEATYELRDGLKVTAGYISYLPGDDFGPIFGLTSHDRAFARLRWDFRVF